MTTRQSAASQFRGVPLRWLLPDIGLNLRWELTLSMLNAPLRCKQGSFGQSACSIFVPLRSDFRTTTTTRFACWLRNRQRPDGNRNRPFHQFCACPAISECQIPLDWADRGTNRLLQFGTFRSINNFPYQFLNSLEHGMIMPRHKCTQYPGDRPGSVGRGPLTHKLGREAAQRKLGQNANLIPRVLNPWGGFVILRGLAPVCLRDGRPRWRASRLFH